MDDFVILHKDKDYLKYCLNKIENKLLKDYRLELNKKKTRIDRVNSGIDFLGYRYIIKNNKIVLKLRTRTKKKFKKKIKHLNILLANNYISEKLYKRGIASYNGILKWGNCNSLLYNNIYYN